jgi:DNA recombination protein RmuC
VISTLMIAILAGLVVGGSLGYLLSRLSGERKLNTATTDIARLTAELEAERSLATKKDEATDRADRDVREAFKAIAADALKTNNESFMDLAAASFAKHQAESKGELQKREQAVENLVKPIGRSLDQLHDHVTSVEKDRKESAGGLNQLLTSLREDQARLQGETHNLVNALRKPSVRGQWGEMTLKRIAELSGLSQHCDFTLQAHVTGEEQSYRPDMVVTLPAGQHLVVDAKTPLDAYLDALDTDSESEAAVHMQRHARHVRDHVNVLGQKSYWQHFENTPEFVVMFLRNEAFLYSALEIDPALIEYAAEKKVIIATPTTLIAILKSVAYGWRQEQLAENARLISERGTELYRRITRFVGHLEKVGKGLRGAGDAYNKAVGSLERSVLPEARRFPELGITVKGEMKELTPVEETVRDVNVAEYLPETTTADVLTDEADSS